MKSCPACDRHVRASESSCPFCAVPLEESGAPVLAVLGLVTMLVGCSDDGLEAGSGSGGSAGTEATAADGPGNTVTSGASGSSGAFETTAVDTDDTALDTSGGGGFIYGSPDSGGTVFECDLVANDCGEGEKCSPWANDGGDEWNATRCVPVAREPVGPGEPCATEGSPVSGFDDCAAGSVCIEVDPTTLMGVCEPLCAAGMDGVLCSDTDQLCVLTGAAGVPFCYTECDPAAPLPECPREEVCTEVNPEVSICT